VPGIEKDMAAHKTPEQTCLTTLPLCKDWAQCTLFKKWPPQQSDFPVATPEYVAAFMARAAQIDGKLVTLTPERAARADAIINEIEKQAMSPNAVSFYDAMLAFFQPPTPNPSPIPVANHLPLIDFDGDRFSTIPTLRGTHWRGRVCTSFHVMRNHHNYVSSCLC
jgi:hypothetical protein